MSNGDAVPAPLVAGFLLDATRSRDELGLAILEAALYLPAIPLAEAPPGGPGAYALVYTGPHQLYQPLANARWPMYVGSTPQLRHRLARHRISISQLRDVSVEDWLVVCLRASAHGEALLLESHLQATCRPVWNSVVTGLGTRAPGAGRPGLRGRVTKLDVLHGPRPWADGPIDEVERRRLRKKVREHLVGHGAPCERWPLEAPAPARASK